MIGGKQHIKENFLFLFVSFLTTFVILYQLMGKRLFDLGVRMHENGGDGLKNYFTAAYQYKWGSSWWFEGMHYPYGDFAVYTDAQLSLVSVLKGLKAIGIDCEDHLLLVFQGLPVVLLSLICFFTFKIARYYQLNHAISLFLGAIALAYSPHLYKLTAHFGLAYGFIVPAYWYFLIKRQDKNKWATIGFGIFILLFAAYLHPYWILILALFTGTYFLSTAILTKKIRWELIVIPAASVLFFLLINKCIDPVSDRPDNPWGMHAYQTTLASLFSPHGFVYDVIGSYLPKKTNREGEAYIGLLIYLLPILWISLVIVCRKSKGKISATIKNPSSLWISALTAIGLILFAMGIHLEIGGEKLLELLPPLKQFRTIGRFAWIYYYIMIVFSGVLFSQLLSLIKSKTVRTLIWALLVLLTGLEVHQYHQKLGEKFERGESDWLKTETKIADILKRSGGDVSQFQALLSLPFSIEGAEKIGVKDRWSIRKQVMPFLFQTGMKSTLTVMSRTSIGQSMKILQLGSGPHLEKDLLKDLSDKRPFLLVALAVDTARFSNLLSKCDLIGYQDNIFLYKTPLSAFAQEKVINLDVPLTIEDVPIQGQDSLWYYDNYDRFGGEGLLSRGALYNPEKIFTIFDIPISLEDTTKVEVSFWIKVQIKKSEAIAFQIRAEDQNNKVIFEETRRDFELLKFDIHSSWARMKINKTLPPKTKRLSLKLYNRHHWVDEVLCTVQGYEPRFDLENGAYKIGHKLVD